MAAGCAKALEGSGWVVAPERVVTNAHVVAGVDEPSVQTGGVGPLHHARVVVFDAARDLAVLAVPGLKAPAIPLGTDLSSADPAVVALAATLLPIVAAFELFDGLQVVGSGVLRGMGRTRPAALFNLVGYYALGLPLAAWLGRPERLGLIGIWWCLALGLAVVAGLSVVWVAFRGPARSTPVL